MNVKYTCVDNKIHIRLKDYKNKEIISGFENKLRYLLSYLLNCCYLPTVLNTIEEDKLLESFNKSSDMQNLTNMLKLNLIKFEFKGIKISKNYKRNRCISFGDIDMNCFPLTIEDNVIKTGSLFEFLHNFGDIDLIKYLFDDGYEVIIQEEREMKLNKFHRKQIRKNLERKIVRKDLVQLW